ncbi:hypothetical protein M9Y10_008772 [Tritrichomonas musculus]|uniref:Uncharacterized protein n=1 Tax=Tritrichomonas musculus TaxID=1915356 RepID=A0ABR2IZ03_9EUKA
MSNYDFIETKGSLERIEKVSNAIRSGIPILNEGETGTSKTRTDIVASQTIVLNFSSQTTKDTDSWGRFSFINGPYTKAFMDEINLAYENVLQCI